ncbi:Got1/Sft2-like vescicle transport protein family, partial [Striga asiatica]
AWLVAEAHLTLRPQFGVCSINQKSLSKPSLIISRKMDKMNQAFEKMKMLVGMEVDDEEQQQESSLIDDFNRNCTLSTKQGTEYAKSVSAFFRLNFGTMQALRVCNLLVCRYYLHALGKLSSFLLLFELKMIKLVAFSPEFVHIFSQNFPVFEHWIHHGLCFCRQSMLVFFHPIKFGITFSFGNLLALGSTAFLIGPKRQLTMMLDPVRIYATAIYIASIIVALFCAVYVRNKLLTLLAIVLEFGALVW